MKEEKSINIAFDITCIIYTISETILIIFSSSIFYLLFKICSSFTWNLTNLHSW